jgi:hypothetical protein
VFEGGVHFTLSPFYFDCLTGVEAGCAKSTYRDNKVEQWSLEPWSPGEINDDDEEIE